MTTLLWFLPYEALPLVLVGGAILVMFGLISARGLLGFVFGFILCGILIEALWPVAWELFGAMSLWWKLAIMLIVGFLLLRMTLTLFFGSAVASHVVSFLVYDVFFRLPARLLIALVGLMFGAARTARNQR